MHEEQDNSQQKDEEHVAQEISEIKTPASRSSDNREKGQDSVNKTRYGRVLRKLDRLAY